MFGTPEILKTVAVLLAGSAAKRNRDLAAQLDLGKNNFVNSGRRMAEEPECSTTGTSQVGSRDLPLKARTNLHFYFSSRTVRVIISKVLSRCGANPDEDSAIYGIAPRPFLYDERSFNTDDLITGAL